MVQNNKGMGGIKIVTADWMKEDEALFIYNGVDQLVRHDLTGKQGERTVKPATGIIVKHIGETPQLKWYKRLWKSAHTNQNKLIGKE